MMLVLLAIALGGAPDPHRYEQEIAAAVRDTKDIFEVPPSLVLAVIKQESAFNPRAESACGARGLMQVMPYNAEKLGLSSGADLWNPRLNILAGVRLLAVLLKHYDGDVIAALVAYNSGPKAKDSPIPQNGETPQYVLRILGYWKTFESTSAP